VTTKRHGRGSAAGPEGRVPFLFGIAQWPYDLALRFSFDLPENEHVWEGEWFDDRFEDAALDIRATAAKLPAALRAADAAGDVLRRASEGGTNVDELAALVAEAPMALDLVVGYLARILDDVAAVVPTCYGQRGKVLAGLRGGLLDLTGGPLAEVDPDLAALIAPGGALPPAVTTIVTAGTRDGVATHAPDLYVLIQSPGFATLPKAAARTLRDHTAVILEAASTLDRQLAEICAWLDGLLEHLIRRVCEQSEEGEALSQRWARGDWPVVMELASADAALHHLP